MRRIRSTFRAKNPAKFVNAAWRAKEAIRLAPFRERDRAEALKKPGAKIAAAEVWGRADAERRRKGERRRIAYFRGLNNYHGYGQARGFHYRWADRIADDGCEAESAAKRAAPKRVRPSRAKQKAA